MFDVGEVDGIDQHKEDCGRNPGRDLGPPVLHIQANRRKLGHADQHIEHPVVPARQETGKAAPIFIGKKTERARYRLFGHHLPQLTHDEKGNKTTERITEQHRRTGHLDGLGYAQKQAGTYGTAQSNKLDMAILQAALEFTLVGSDFHGNIFLL